MLSPTNCGLLGFWEKMREKQKKKTLVVYSLIIE